MLHRRPARRYTRIGLGLGLSVVVLMGVTAVWSVANAAGTAYFVAPTGSDSNSGTTAAAPFLSIQKALDLATPGTTITLAAGAYTQSIVTKTAGTAANPITIRGPEQGKNLSGRYQAVLYPRTANAVAINHSYYTLDGFTIDGQKAIQPSEYPTTLAAVRGFKDSVQSRTVNSKLVFVGADDASRDITGTRISNMFLNGSGGECVRFRNRAAASLVVDSVIQWCGMRASGDDSSQYKYHNGEGVYIGTSPKSSDQPLYASDTSNNIVVRDSIVHTFGSECLEVKENAHDNRIEDSDCGYNDEPKSFNGSNIELRGDHNLIRRTTVHDSRSWNVKMQSDSTDYPGGNSIEQSSFAAAAAPALRSTQATTGSTFCGNTFDAAPNTDPAGKLGDPTQPCTGVDTQRPTVSVTAPADGATVSGTVAITADPADDRGVTSVDFVVDGVALGTSTAAPWTRSWTVPTAPGPHTITVTAHDAADNVATAKINVTGSDAPPADTTPPTAPTGVTAQATSATSATVSWTAATDDVGVTGYRVLRNSTQIGTTTTALTYTDTGLAPGTTASYTVVAVDAAGNASPASNSAIVTTPGDTAPGAQVIAVEAESGVLTAPMTIASDTNAQGGKYVVQTTGSGTGRVTYSISVPVAASYVPAFRVIGPSTSSDSFNYSFDGGSAQVLNVPSSARTAWTWVTVPAVNLIAGNHTLVVSKRENGARLDAFTLTPPNPTPPTSQPVTTPPTTAPTTPPTTTTPPPPPVMDGTALFEAEVGTVKSGMAVASDPSASGQKYVVAKSSGGTVTYTLSVPTNGTYMIAGYIKASSASADSFTVKLDAGSTAVWNLTRPSTSWTYDATTNPTFTLPAGTHKLTLSYREAGASVDRMVLLKR